jgi:hypothetical protein
MSLHIVFRHLVENLRAVRNVRAVRVLDEGALLVTVAQPSFNEDIIIYLLAGELSVGFIKKTLNANTRADKHTLYILALDLITADGHSATMSDGLQLLLQAYGNQVYAYSLTAGSKVSIFPVHVDHLGSLTYGNPVKLADLSVDYTTIDSPYIMGVRKIASFTARHFNTTVDIPVDDPLREFYDVLGVPVTATVDDVKRAYRKKARQYHPDRDKSPGATARMQAINEAYARILERLAESSL